MIEMNNESIKEEPLKQLTENELSRLTPLVFRRRRLSWNKRNRLHCRLRPFFKNIRSRLQRDVSSYSRRFPLSVVLRND